MTLLPAVYLLAPAANAVPISGTFAQVLVVDVGGRISENDSQLDATSAMADASLGSASGTARASVNPLADFMMSTGASATIVDAPDATDKAVNATGQVADTFFLANSTVAQSFEYTLAIEGSTSSVHGQEPNGEFLDDSYFTDCLRAFPSNCDSSNTMGNVFLSLQSGVGDAITGDGFETEFLLEDLFNGDGALSGAIELPLSFDVAAGVEWIVVNVRLNVVRAPLVPFRSSPIGVTDFGSTLSFGFSDPSQFSSRLSGAPLSPLSVAEPGPLFLLLGAFLALAAVRRGQANRIP